MENAVLIGPDFSELGWGAAKFTPHIVWKKKVEYKDKNVKFIVCCRPDRQDIYGDIADKFESLIIKGEGTKYLARAFSLGGLDLQDHRALAFQFFNKYSKNYNILEHIYKFHNSDFPENKMLYHFSPRPGNFTLLKEQPYFKNGKDIITIGSRVRIGAGLADRNWNYWKPLYNLIYNDPNIMEKYNIVLVGKSPDYIPDSRFFDINDINLVKNTSLVGLTIECMKHSSLVIGSESAIPLLSVMLNLPTLMWGSKQVFCVNNRFGQFFKEKQIILDDPRFGIRPEVIFSEMKKILNQENTSSGGVYTTTRFS